MNKLIWSMMMLRRKLTILISLIMITRCSGVSEVISEATEIIGVIRLGLNLVQYMNKVFAEVCGDDCNLSLEGVNSLDKELLQQSIKMTQKMNDIEHSIAGVQASIYSLHRTLPTYVRYEIKFDRLEQVINNIWSQYALLEFYQENMETVEQHTLEDFSSAISSHRPGSIRSNLNVLHDLVVPRHLSISSGLLSTLATQIKVTWIRDMIQLRHRWWTTNSEPTTCYFSSSVLTNLLTCSSLITKYFNHNKWGGCSWISGLFRT